MKASRRGCSVLTSEIGVLGAKLLRSDPVRDGSVRILSTSSARSNVDTRGWDYSTHIPLTPLQKALVAVGSAVGALANPARADLVAAVGETTGWAAYLNVRDRMRKTASGRKILLERPRVLNSTVGHAWGMPEGTFGHAYAKFMGDRNFQADDRPPVRFVDDPELAYIACRMREVHDFWHTLFDCHTNVLGELALKAVEFAQTGLPMTALAVLGAQWRLKEDQRQVLLRELLPWAVRAGTACEDLMSIYYEKHFEEDLLDLRQRWRVTPAPQIFRRQDQERMAAHSTILDTAATL